MTPEQHADRALELSDAALTTASAWGGEARAIVQALAALTHAVLAAVEPPPQGEEGGDA